MNDFFKNVNPDTLKKARNTIDQMLTEQQKQKLIQQFGHMSKEELLRRVSQMAGDRSMEDLLQSLDQKTLSEKLSFQTDPGSSNSPK